MKQGSILLLCAALLLGCAGDPPKSRPDLARHRFAVLSLAGGDMHHFHEGLTRLDSFDTMNDLRSWGLDDELAPRLASAVRATLGADVVIPQVDRRSLERIYDETAGQKLFPNYWEPNWDNVSNELASVAAASGADKIIVLARTKVGSFRGFGTFTALGVGDNRAAYAAIAVYLVDPRGKSKQSVIWKPESGNIFKHRRHPKDLPWTEVPKALSTKTPQEMSAAEQAQLRDVFLQLANASAIGDAVARLFNVPVRYVPESAYRAASTPAVLPPIPPAPPGKSAIAVQGAALRGRPAFEAPVVTPLAAGTSVTLDAFLQNSSGNWWYATTQGQGGWIPETQLQMR